MAKTTAVAPSDYHQRPVAEAARGAWPRGRIDLPDRILVRIADTGCPLAARSGIMSRQRVRTHLYPFAAASAGVVLYALWIRPRLLTWGATGDETTRAYPGDELVPDPDGGATMATTLPAPPEKVWPWLVQMGGDRGGWYSWDWLDNNGEPSADRIVPEWQSLEQGHHLYRAPNGPSRFIVSVLQANRTLVLRGDYSEHIDGIWGFHLRPAPGERTRLVARTRNRAARPRPVMRLIGLMWEPVHFIMQTRQFQNLRTRVAAEM